MSLQMVIEYNASVMVAAGWRSVRITAKVESLSEKMAKVVEVLAIDGDSPKGYASRTGANRQKYNASSVALREVGAKKRLSACEVVA
jgi:hypothetical protein